MTTPQALTQAPIQVGAWVRWWHNGWRHGWVMEAGTKWVKVAYLGKSKRLPLSEVQPYDARSSASPR